MQAELGYPFEVAGLMADLSTLPVDFVYGRRYIVPQGAPTSGAVCNWVAHNRIDKPLLELCQQWDMAYTRYADDLAFSSAKNLSRGEVNRFIKDAIKIVRAGGYQINHKKLRVARKSRQQRLLGMTVNEKPNVMRVHYRRLRARIHHCKYKGFDRVAAEMNMESGEALKSQIEGLISYYHMINPEKAAKLKQQLEEAKDGPLLHRK